MPSPIPQGHAEGSELITFNRVTPFYRVVSIFMASKAVSPFFFFLMISITLSSDLKKTVPHKPARPKVLLQKDLLTLIRIQTHFECFDHHLLTRFH
jgi:hypothetical protein